MHSFNCIFRKIYFHLISVKKKYNKKILTEENVINQSIGKFFKTGED